MADASTSATAIDLSRLPPPIFLAPQSFDQIKANLIAQLRELLPEFDGTDETSPAVKLLEIFAYRETIIRQAFNDHALRTMLPYATGADLENLGALMNVARLTVNEADGTQPALYESDADLRRRIQLAAESFSTAGPATAYRFHALSADPTIADAMASSPAPGQVLVSILSRMGDGTATPDQIAAVEAVLTSREVRPLTDQIIVASVAPLPFTVLATLHLFRGPDGIVVLASAETRLEQYLADCRHIGRPVTRSGIIAALHVEGVINVTLTQPAADVTPSATQIAHCTGSDVELAND